MKFAAIFFATVLVLVLAADGPVNNSTPPTLMLSTEVLGRWPPTVMVEV